MTTAEQVPHSREAELSVLCACIRDPARVTDFGTSLGDGAFYLPHHRVVWSAMRDIVKRRDPLDALTLAEELYRAKNLDRAGGPDYIGDIIDYSGTTIDVDHSVGMLRDLELSRRVINTATKVAEEGYRPETRRDIKGFADRSLSAMMAATRHTRTTRISTIAEIMERGLKDIESRAGRDGAIGLPIGLRDLDERLLGMQRQNLIVLGAPPSQGKTVLALQATQSVCWAGYHAVWFPLDMSESDMRDRLISSEGRIPLQAIRKGEMNPDQWASAARVSSAMSGWKLEFVDEVRLTVDDVRAHCLQLSAHEPLDLVVVDYLQLLRPTSRGQKRHETVGEAASELKNLAKELDAAVIAVSSMNRESMKRGDGRPELSDFKESGDVEYAANVAIGVHRPGKNGKCADDRMDVHLLKNKQGPLGTVPVAWIGNQVRLEDWSGPNINPDWQETYR
jgi:replicative DNA helicase